MRSIFILGLLAFTVASHPVVAQFNPLSGIISGIEAAAEDRSASDIGTDTKLKASIVTVLSDKLGKEGALIGVDVYEQDIMLTGTISTTKLKIEAEALVKKEKGVKKIYNELLLEADRAKKDNKGGAESFVDDTVIEKKIAAQFASTKGVNHTNFRWRVVKGNVFLFGRALSAAENAKVVEIAKGIADVVAVTNRAKVAPKPATKK